MTSEAKTIAPSNSAHDESSTESWEDVKVQPDTTPDVLTEEMSPAEVQEESEREVEEAHDEEDEDEESQSQEEPVSEEPPPVEAEEEEDVKTAERESIDAVAPLPEETTIGGFDADALATLGTALDLDIELDDTLRLDATLKELSQVERKRVSSDIVAMDATQSIDMFKSRSAASGRRLSDSTFATEELFDSPRESADGRSPERRVGFVVVGASGSSDESSESEEMREMERRLSNLVERHRRASLPKIPGAVAEMQRSESGSTQDSVNSGISMHLSAEDAAIIGSIAANPQSATMLVGAMAPLMESPLAGGSHVMDVPPAAYSPQQQLDFQRSASMEAGSRASVPIGDGGFSMAPPSVEGPYVATEQSASSESSLAGHNVYAMLQSTGVTPKQVVAGIALGVGAYALYKLYSWVTGATDIDEEMPKARRGSHKMALARRRAFR